MTARQIIVPGAMPSLDANGRVLPAKFRFYLPSSGGTPTTVYTDNTLTVPHPFPILSDSAGRWPPMWADDANSFDVGWSDQVFDETIQVFAGLTPAADAVLASAALSQAAAVQAAASGSAAAQSAAAAAASASVAAAAAVAGGVVLKATSASPNTIGTGDHVFTLDQTGVDFAAGMDVQASVVGDAATRMVGTVKTFVDPLLTVTVPGGGTSGAGTFSAWSISITAVGGVQSMAGLTGIIAAAAAKAALAIVPADVAGFNAAVDARAAAFAVAL